MFRIVFALLVTTLGAYMHFGTYMTTMFFSDHLLLLWCSPEYSHPSANFPHLILNSWVAILHHLMGTRVAENCDKTQPEESSLCLCCGVSTSDALSCVLPKHFSASSSSVPARLSGKLKSLWILISCPLRPPLISSTSAIQEVHLQSTLQCCDTLPSFQNSSSLQMPIVQQQLEVNSAT